MTACRRSCLHRRLVLDYRDARLAGEQRRDETVGAYGYASEEWSSYPPPIAFREWLKQTRGSDE